MAKSKFFDVARQVFIIVCFVSMFCRVSCVLVNVTRNEQDIFAYPLAKGIDNCWSDDNIKAACKKGKASRHGCICMCGRDKSTFLKNELSCFENWKMRNKSNTWTFLLSSELENVRTPVGVVKLNSSVNIIKIRMNPNVIPTNAKSCQPYRVEIRDKNGRWTLVTNQFLKHMSLNTRISSDNKISSNLTLQLKRSVTAYPFAGEIMRIRINCRTVDDFIIFKVAGTFRVEFPEIPSESSFVTPTRTLSASPLGNSTISSTTQVFSITSLSYQQYSIRTSPAAIYRSTYLSITPSITIVSSQIKSSETGTKLLFSSISPTTTSSVNSSSPDQFKHSKDSSTKVIIGVVIGVVLAIIILVVIVFYILRKKKQNANISGMSDSTRRAAFDAMVNKNFPLPTLANPVCDDLVYHNPENFNSYIKRKSGVKTIDNADYDQCIVVENPSARNGVASVYDNIAPPQSEEELAYHALDPAKRDPSNKYQSLVHPAENDYSTIRDGAGTPEPLQEPVYSVIEDEPHKISTSDKQPKSDPVYNVLEANDSSLQPVPEPVYNVLEQSNEIQGKQEPVYSVPENQ